jgi:hypothetical protein
MPSLIPIPKKGDKSFWHPDSQELILTAAAVTTVFTFWNAINIRPSILTDPGYRDQYEGLKHHMNLSMAVILGISVGFAAIYGERGYLPAAASIGTGAVLYAWAYGEMLKHPLEEESLIENPLNAKSMEMRIHTDYPELYRPMYLMTKKPEHMRAATNFQKNRREAAMIS